MEATNATVCDMVRSHLSACEAVMKPGVGGSWAVLVVAACALCGEGRAATSFRAHQQEDNELSDTDYLKVGRSLNLLTRYGFLTLTVKVCPLRSENTWVFVERTVEVFQPNSYWAVSPKQLSDPPNTYDQHFVIDFCDTINDVFTAYFDNFYIEGVPEPHRVFTSSFSAQTKGQQLGIPTAYLSSKYSFVMVRLLRRKRRATLEGNLKLSSYFTRAVVDLRVGSKESVNQFLDRFGTHVIVEYEVGDMMYQVYVLGNRTYIDLKNNFARSQSQNDLSRIEQHLTPYNTVHVGKVKLASGHPNFEEAVGNELYSGSFFGYYQSIFEIFKNQEVEKKLEQLDGEVMLSLRLEKITKIVPRSPKRRWLKEILDNTLSLYYITM